MQRVIVHWTAGNYQPGPALAYYHYLIDGNGQVVCGTHPVTANSPVRKGHPYAAHTAGLNSYSIGIAMCCMWRARENPFSPGPFPMRMEQWAAAARLAARACAAYRIVVAPHTVLGHGEVERRLGVPQRGKWDPLAYPSGDGRWILGVQAMNDFRNLVMREREALLT